MGTMPTSRAGRAIFRTIAFDDDGQDFPTPIGAHEPSTLPLLVDGVRTPGGGEQAMEVALADLECDNCTLQMLQYLSPGPPYAPGKFYDPCADITLPWVRRRSSP